MKVLCTLPSAWHLLKIKCIVDGIFSSDFTSYNEYSLLKHWVSWHFTQNKVSLRMHDDLMLLLCILSELYSHIDVFYSHMIYFHSYFRVLPTQYWNFSLLKIWCHCGCNVLLNFLGALNSTLFAVYRHYSWGNPCRNIFRSLLGPVSRKTRKLFGPLKPFLINLYLKSERCIRLKLLVWREPLFILRRCE